MSEAGERSSMESELPLIEGIIEQVKRMGPDDSPRADE